jgi:hypothetical protein
MTVLLFKSRSGRSSQKLNGESNRGVEYELRLAIAVAWISSSTMNHALLLTLLILSTSVDRPHPRERHQVFLAQEPDQAACRSARIAGRTVAGGNTHHEPSSCRKKKIASDPAGRAASTQT